MKKPTTTIKCLELGCCPIDGGTLAMVFRHIDSDGLTMYIKTVCESCDFVSGIVEMVAEEEV